MKPADIDSYIAAFPEHVRESLSAVRSTIRRAAPEAIETIKYGIPTFVLGENLVHFAAFKHHIGFYPSPSGITAFRDKLSGYKCAKGTVQLPLDRSMPVGLIGQIVRYRVKEAKARARR